VEKVWLGRGDPFGFSRLEVAHSFIFAAAWRRIDSPRSIVVTRLVRVIQARAPDLQRRLGPPDRVFARPEDDGVWA
jgi:hypothetical protein